jgi:hypothetical protein
MQLSELLIVSVTFFSASNGGRKNLPGNLLSGGIYRPHFVIDSNNQNKEEYLGVAFQSQQNELEADKKIDALVSKLYPDVDYSGLTSGTTFTIREGNKIVGIGIVV